jgi:sugar/nucleoside kinase (ribokinase family)
MMGVLVLGTVALDTVKTPFGWHERMLGGSAAHFSMSARLFTDLSLVAVVGEDFPLEHIAFLRAKGIDLSSLAIKKGKTFHWQGEYKNDLNSAITLKTELGVLADFNPQITSEQSKMKYLFLANVDPDIQFSLLKLMRAPRIVALDSMNYWINTKRKSLLKILKKVDIYVANDQEALSLSQESNILQAARSLNKIGAKMVLIKKGEHGVIFYNGRSFFSLPAYPAERVIDPTGAGDTFAGGFIGYLAMKGKVNDQEIKNALAYGTIAASFNIESFGLEKTAKLKMKDIDTRLIKFKNCVNF